MQSTNSIIARKGFLPLLLILSGAALLIIAVAVDPLSLSAPGFGPNQLALAISGLVILLAGVALVSTINRRHIAEWLLVGAGVVAVAFAADLLVVGGLPGMGSKQLLLASATFGVLLIGLLPATAAPPPATLPRLSDWRALWADNQLKATQFLSILLQLGLLVFVIRQYALENQAFYHNIMLLTLYGFIIHYFLPLRYRLPFFLLLSLTAIFGVLGLANALWLVGIGLGLIAICHLPIPFSGRILLLLLVGAVLAMLRAEWLPAPWLAAVWPILGSIFMFRLIIYLYDLKHSKKPASVTSTLAYFFLLPNVVFPLFPVVDYATFRRTYFNEEQHHIFQRGVQWMFWGVLQLVLYRFVNYYVVIAVEEVTNALEVARYIIANYLLYIRVSGQFFVIIGLLHLFGFNLPRTHDRYFLASSFTDLWRRNNIYWKDFMQKVFYMPLYFRLGRLGTTSKLVVATAFVIALTWFFHAYQWFWLRGRFLLSAPDMLFWFLLGTLVVVNIVREARRGRKRTLGERVLTWRDLLSSSFRIAGTFAGIAILWSLWSSETIADALALWAVAATPEGVLTLVFVFLGLMLVLGSVLWVDHQTGQRKQATVDHTRDFFRSAARNGALIAALFLLGNPAVYNWLGGQAGSLLADLGTARLSDRDAKLLQKGYYEDLIGVSQFNNDLWDIYTKRPSDWPLIQETDAARMTGDFQIIELVPSTQIIYHGEPLRINRWGMRDQEYDLVPPPNTYRIALAGTSFVMGSGVADHQVFEAVLEERLNQENDGRFYDQYQILNFAVAGYSALQELLALETRALDFEPDALLFVGHQLEEEIIVRNLANRLITGVEMPYAYLNEVAGQAGVVEGMTQAEAERRLKPYGRELIIWTYERAVALARERGMQPLWVFVPTLETEMVAEETAALIQLAAEAGFTTLDLSNAYDQQDVSSLIVADWDKHPNARGHQLLADHLYEAFRAKEGAIPFHFSN